MTRRKREDIQGLRAVAIVMVLLFHFFPKYFPNGYVGVDMFFVISGYIISMVFPKELSTKKILDFYYRRVKRILPLYFATVLVILIGTVLFAAQSFAEFNMASGKRALLMISNILSASSAELDYQRLIDNAEDLFTHCWSLCLEIQWYLLAPIFFSFRSSRIHICQVLFGVSAFYYITSDESTAFNSVFARLWQFTPGIIANEFVRPRTTIEKDLFENDKSIPFFNSKSQSGHDILTVLIQFFVLALMLGFMPVEYPPTLLRVIVTISTSAILLSGAVVETPLLKSPVLSWIGNVSYSLYLIHWPIYITGEQYGSNPIFGLLISIALSALVYYFFEQKYLKWQKKDILVFVAGVFASALFISINGMDIRSTIHAELTSKEIAAFNNPDMPWLAINIAEGALVNCTNNIFSPLCKYERMFGIRTNSPYGHCNMPNGNGSYNMLVLGNSFAANQGEMVYRVFGKFAKRFDVYSIAGCEPLVTTKFSWCPTIGNYGRQAVEYFKPCTSEKFGKKYDIHQYRVISSNSKINTTVIDDDPIFAEMLANIRFCEKFTKKQALPWCSESCTTAPVTAMIQEKKNLTQIGDRFIERGEKYARIRISELTKKCKKCEVIDFEPYLPLYSTGMPTFYDFKRNLVFLDNQNHLNKFGKERIQPVFDDLARKFEQNHQQLDTGACH